MESPDGLKKEVSNDSFLDSLYTNKLSNKQIKMFASKEKRRKPLLKTYRHT